MDQRKLWISLRESINAAISDLNRFNVVETSLKLFSVNILRGRGLLCRAIIKKLLVDKANAPVLASLACVVNSKLPEVGETLVARVVILFKRGYVSDDGETVDATLLFICELVLQGVCDDVLVLQVLQVLLDKAPTPDSIRTAANVIERVGGHLEQKLKPALNMVFDRLRDLLQEGKFGTGTQRLITELMRLRRSGLVLKLDQKLDLVEGIDKQTQFVDLSEKQDAELELNYFQSDSDYEAAEAEYAEAKKQILPEISEEEGLVKLEERKSDLLSKVTDYTDAELLASQKNIYLTIMSSMSADEAVHKLLKVKKTQKMESDLLVDMIVKCCAQEKTYSKYFGVIGEKLCGMSRQWHATFARQFVEKYNTIYQYEGVQLRNIGKFFGHLLAADVLDPSETLGCIKLTESDTTSAGRVFIKFLFQAMVEELGISEVQKIVQDEELRRHIQGMFPVVDATEDDDSHLLFAINYFTAIGLGVLTQEMRDVYANLPRRGRKRSRSHGLESGSSRSGSYSRSRSGSYSRSRSRSYSRSRSRSRSYSRSRSRSRSGSYSRSPSHSRSRSRSRSGSQTRERRRNSVYSRRDQIDGH